jgi:hypothetical protein
MPGSALVAALSRVGVRVEEDEEEAGGSSRGGGSKFLAAAAAEEARREAESRSLQGRGLPPEEEEEEEGEGEGGADLTETVISHGTYRRHLAEIMAGLDDAYDAVTAYCALACLSAPYPNVDEQGRRINPEKRVPKGMRPKLEALPPAIATLRGQCRQLLHAFLLHVRVPDFDLAKPSGGDPVKGLLNGQRTQRDGTKTDHGDKNPKV